MALQQIPAATVSTGNVWKYYSAPANATATTLGNPTYIGKVNGYWFIGTSNGFLLYSSDAKTWSRWASTATEGINQINGVIYGNATYVIYGGGGFVLSASTLGGTLTSRTSQFAGDDVIDAIYMAGSVNLFIIVGGNGYVSTSADGATWTARTGGQSTNQILSIAVNDTNNLAILTAGGGIANNASYSSNGTSWTAFSPDNSSTSSASSQIFYDAGNSKWIYANDSDQWYESTTPTTTPWTTKVNLPISYGESSGNTAKYVNGGTVYLSKDSTNNKWIVISRLDGGWFNIYTFDPTVSVTAGGSSKIYKLDTVENLRVTGRVGINSYTIGTAALAYDSGVFVGAGVGTLAIISNA